MQNQDHSCQQQLEALRKEYEEFVYIVSHDLKAPLRAISNLSGWIKEDAGSQLDEETQHNLELLQNRAERMERMLNGLLLFSRATRQDLDVREVNVHDLVQDLALPYQQERGLRLHLHNLPVFTTYAKKLETVLHHLLQNAVKFNEQEQPEVWLEAREQEESYLFTVRDNGVGIPPDAQEKVFKIFFSVQSRDQQENVGVGLSIIRKIIQFVGGTLHLHSEVGQGATFSFTWPKTVSA
ncbi:sensor histidine kinase [Rufibacter psychrotolerans]|uniref:sensor histidine kinase n=1 Tax=Rufibacter psychrotolerans TaxID=2812556 RepID=UPI001968117E|nr:ATP-binding protein [Rufibacter sp. SYSU D00308]